MPNNKDDQPNLEDEKSLVDWLTDEDVSQDERQRRATLVEGEYTRRPDASQAVLNALASIRQGPPSANQ